MESVVLKVIWGFALAVIFPFLGWAGHRGLKNQRERFKELHTKLEKMETEYDQKSEKFEDHISELRDKDFEIQAKVIQLEASSVKRQELVELLKGLESSIEARFDKSFNRLEENFSKLLDKLK